MELDRARIIDQNFKRRVLAQDFPQAKSLTTPQQASLSKDSFISLFDSQLKSRHLDLMARLLREQNKGFYTIGSSGHEGNAAIAKVFRKDDLAFLHYRSGAFVIERAKKDPSIDIIYDQVLSLVASREDPISGGRHKVFGSVPLYIPPQTSTIASHLPKALGTAISITTSKAIKNNTFTKLAKDSVVLCSFGDGSVNHSTAQGAFNAAQWVQKTRRSLPMVFICEDNGFGISVPTTPDWVEHIFGKRDFLHYLSCDGLNLADVTVAALKAEHLARVKHEPVFLHMKTVRLLGHAGSDIELQYRTQQEIEQTESDDPLLHSARTLCEHWLSPQEVIDHYEKVRECVKAATERALIVQKLLNAEDIVSAIIPPLNPAPIKPNAVVQEKQEQKKNMAQALNLALSEVLARYPNTVVFGEDVGKKGGVYRITADLQKKYGPLRVFDTIIDEQTILGTAIGFAHNGYIPIPEIQFLAYTHNAIDQIRGEAATLSFFSKGQYTNPMVCRIPSFGYQKGFGGHFHNDNAFAFLREIPGVIIVCPSKANDAVKLLRASIELANTFQRVVIFLEPIALYMCKDKYQPGDNLALETYPPINETLSLGELGIEGNLKSDTVIISYGNGMALARQAAFELKQDYQIDIKLMDLRWLAPLNTQGILKEIQHCKNILIVDECRNTASLSEQLMALIMEQMHPSPMKIKRITAKDSFIPIGNAWEFILPSKDQIVQSILLMLQTH
ncbi:MAG: MFS transporter [Proteobacteria bacterium]|nr:MFS transporter [Pseudomonadota bacterium]